MGLGKREKSMSKSEVSTLGRGLISVPRTAGSGTPSREGGPLDETKILFEKAL